MSFQRWRKSMQLLLLAAFPLAGADFKPVAERIQEQIMNRFADSHGIITDYRGLKGEIVLPTPEECERNIPNAKGYWTPIENGGFFTGLYLLGQCRRYRQEKSENTRTLIRRLVGGLCKLQDVATVPGFIARGVGTDGKCHYKSSSSDQFFPWVIGVDAYLDTDIPSAKLWRNALPPAEMLSKKTIGVCPKKRSCSELPEILRRRVIMPLRGCFIFFMYLRNTREIRTGES